MIEQFWSHGKILICKDLRRFAVLNHIHRERDERL